MPSRDSTLILASTSTYRAKLLDRLRIPFETSAPAVDESRLPNETFD
ncbi:MAG: Maf family protein, partial [Pseudomonadota bacterium]|nr:Maf family protein [Pseudomonadota bacterium]